MSIDNVIAKLSPLERKTIPFLKEGKTFLEIVKDSKLKEVEVMRALQWLENKEVLEIKEESEKLIVLGNNGKKYLEEGLPEKRFLAAVKTKWTTLNALENKAGLTKEEINICIGVLKKKAAIDLRKEKGLIVMANSIGIGLLQKDWFEEKFLNKKFPLIYEDLNDEDRFAFEVLAQRKDIVKKEEPKTRTIFLTKLGNELIKKGIKDGKFVDKLTSTMLKSGSWKSKKFRQYDVEINVPNIYGGKRHFVSQAISSAKRIWLDMGFKEMSGNMVQQSFWNFDALFTAQDHPVRDMQDTFFIGNPENGKLPSKKLVEAVKAAHENGGNTGSLGWRYKWDSKIAKKNVLRTHTTALSARTLASLNKKDLPAKYFSFGKCFRNETLDWCHLFEFNQTEGIVIDENANFRHLLGYLKEFFKKMGFEKARFRPAYFPYTELSVEIDVYNTQRKKWVELGGAGILRPEVVKPLLGIDVPVLAWGPGFDRIILEFFNISDIRELYKNDLKQLRKIKTWIK